MSDRMDVALAKIRAEGITEEKRICDTILSEVFTPELRHLFDGHGGDGAGHFANGVKIEEPPFVIPSLHKKPFGVEDAAAKALLFKTPQDAYRPGIYEQLFPNAEIKYIHLTRGCAPAVNGLMDGWLSPAGFFSHDIKRITGKELNIGGYSDKSDSAKAWWKFDLPPNWKQFTDKPLEEVCLNQWKSAHEAILANKQICLRTKFEDFLKNPQKETDKILDTVELSRIPVGQLPVVMATKTPNPTRWLERKEVLSPLLERPGIKNLMRELGYSENVAQEPMVR